MFKYILAFALSIVIQVDASGEEIAELRVVNEPVIKLESGSERTNSKFYRGEKLVLEQSVWRVEGKRERYGQTVWIDGNRAVTVSRTLDYHFRCVGVKNPCPPFEEIDLDMDSDWDLLLFENRSITEAFEIDEDGFLTPVSSVLLNQANRKAKEDSEWLLKHLAKKLKQ